MKTNLMFLAFSILVGICVSAKQVGAQVTMINGHSADALRIESEPSGYSSGMFSTVLDTIFSFSAPGTAPRGLTWDGQYLWHSDSDADMVYKMTTTGIVISSFPFSQTGGDLAWDGSNLWMVDEQAALLYRIDTTTGMALDTLSLPSSGQSDPNGWGIAWDGQYLWHSEYWTTAMIYKLDPQNGQVVDSFPPPENLILGIEWVSGFLYGATTSGHLVYQIDPATGAVLDTEPWQIGFALGLTYDGQYFWNVDDNNQRIYQVSSTLTAIEPEPENWPGNFLLFQNYPNPFNPSTTIEYHLASTNQIELKIYNHLGQEVRTLVNNSQPAGDYRLDWDGQDSKGNLAPSGIYFYRLRAGSFTETRKMLLLR